MTFAARCVGMCVQIPWWLPAGTAPPPLCSSVCSVRCAYRREEVLSSALSLRCAWRTASRHGLPTTMSFRSKMKGLFADARRKRKSSAPEPAVKVEPLRDRVVLFVAKNVEAHHEIVKLLASGCLLFVCAKREDIENGLSVHNELLKHEVMELDPVSEESAMAVVNQVISEFGKLDCVVLGLDEGQREEEDQASFERLEDVLNANLYPVVNLLFHSIPRFHMCNSPQVVLLSTMAGEIPLPTMPTYCAARHAVHSFVKKLRQEEKLKVSIALGFAQDTAPTPPRTPPQGADGEDASGDTPQQTRARVYARSVFSHLKDHKLSDTWYLGPKNKLFEMESDIASSDV